VTRTYMNDRWCVRCNRDLPTPYLVKNQNFVYRHGIVADLGCGNGRNSLFLKGLGFNVEPIDMVGDYGRPCVIGSEPLPFKDGAVSTFLLNYTLMFLNPDERKFLYSEIKRTGHQYCNAIVELYPAKDSFTPDKRSMWKLMSEIEESLPFVVMRRSKSGKLILSRVMGGE
jgi:hypothetical protein